MKKGVVIQYVCLLATLLVFGAVIFLPALKPAVTVQGLQGVQGVAGEKGEKGDTGATGLWGLQGEKGDTGATGLWGLRGPQGLQGERGYSVNLPKLYKQISPAVVWIGAQQEYWDGDVVKWQGTGFFVTPCLIATAGHVTGGTKVFEVMLIDGTRAIADFVYAEDIDRCDVGFIQLREEYRIERPYLEFDTDIEAGEGVIILGYPWGSNETISITSGIVAAPKHKWYPYLKLSLFVDVASYPGNSGSPILNMDGEVIGILVGGPHENECYSMCTPARLVELAMQKALAEIALREAK